MPACQEEYVEQRQEEQKAKEQQDIEDEAHRRQVWRPQPQQAAATEQPPLPPIQAGGPSPFPTPPSAFNKCLTCHALLEEGETMQCSMCKGDNEQN
jgi:nitrate reductase cytochrome c-type subunit